MVDLPFFPKKKDDAPLNPPIDNFPPDEYGLREDNELALARRLSADTSYEYLMGLITPDRLEGSETHQLLTKDALTTKIDKNEFFVGQMYFSLLIDFLDLDLRMPAHKVHAEYLNWLDLHSSVEGFGREQLNTTIIGRKYQKDEKTQPMMKM